MGQEAAAYLDEVADGGAVEFGEAGGLDLVDRFGAKFEETGLEGGKGKENEEGFMLKLIQESVLAVLASPSFHPLASPPIIQQGAASAGENIGAPTLRTPDS